MFKTLLRGAALAFALVATPVVAQQVWKWSQTPATNATADPAINWATGMAPSAVSPSARAMMAAVAKYRDDVNGTVFTGGTSTAYTASTNEGITNPPPQGFKFTFSVHQTNGAAATLALDAGTAYPLQASAGNAVPAAALVAISIYSVTFCSTCSGSGAWLLHGVFGSPTTVPIGGIIDFAGTTAPNSNFALLAGQCISRTTYAALFAITGTIFGVCDGSTTFGLPDARGRMVAGLGNMGGSDASRITVAGGNFDGTVLGGTGGLQNHTTTIAELPVHTPAGTLAPLTATGTTGGPNTQHFHSGTTGIESTTHTHGVNDATSKTGTFTGGGSNGWGGNATVQSSGQNTPHTHDFTTGVENVTHSHTFTSNAMTPVFTGTPIGSGNAHTILPPAIILSKIIRIF